MRKIIRALLTLVFIATCALSCACFFWIPAGLKDGFTLDAFDTGSSVYWWIGMLAFLAVASALCYVWVRVLEARQWIKEQCLN